MWKNTRHPWGKMTMDSQGFQYWRWSNILIIKWVPVNTLSLVLAICEQTVTGHLHFINK